MTWQGVKDRAAAGLCGVLLAVALYALAFLILLVGAIAWMHVAALLEWVGAR